MTLCHGDLWKVLVLLFEIKVLYLVACNTALTFLFCSTCQISVPHVSIHVFLQVIPSLSGLYQKVQVEVVANGSLKASFNRQKNMLGKRERDTAYLSYIGRKSVATSHLY